MQGIWYVSPKEIMIHTLRTADIDSPEGPASCSVSLLVFLSELLIPLSCFTWLTPVWSSELAYHCLSPKKRLMVGS